MEGKDVEKALRKRIRSGEVRRQDVVRRLAELAFGRVNDCVRLVMEEAADLDKLDLSLLGEIRRSDKGMVEVKLLDRLQVLEQLAEMTGEADAGMEGFLQALRGGDGA